jgi:hypothetical protein
MVAAIVAALILAYAIGLFRAGETAAPADGPRDTNLLWICLTCPRRGYGVGSVGGTVNLVEPVEAS